MKNWDEIRGFVMLLDFPVTTCFFSGSDISRPYSFFLLIAQLYANLVVELSVLECGNKVLAAR